MTTKPNTLDIYLETARNGALQAGTVLIEHFMKLDSSKINEKAKNDFVTDMDKKSEEIIKNHILSNFQDHDILAEESLAETRNSPFLWIIDPLDGTSNYIHGVPCFAISIALEIYGELSMGLIYDPLSKSIYTATKGNGAWKNSKPICVSPSGSLSNSLIATGFPFRKKDIIDTYLKIFRKLFLQVSGIRRCGSACMDLAHTAEGIFGGFFEYSLSPWDFAAGVILIKEAGGRVSDFEGTDNYFKTGNIVAGSQKIHEEMLKIIRA